MVLSRSTSTPSLAGLAHAGSGHGLTCLLTPLHSERSLSLALVQHLAQELPDLDFTLEDREGVDVLWVCGYERGNSDLIRSLREHHPLALLLVTAREPEELWAAEVHAAGADLALSWPLDIGRLGETLRRRAHLRRA
jgi:hypothetical protein